MNKQKRSSVSGAMVLALVLLIAVSVGCKMLGGRTTERNGADSANSMKGLPAADICQMLAHPNFENRYEYDGSGCSGSTYFGARDTRTASYETDLRPSFSYGAIGEQGVITKVMLAMSKRPDGAQFFAAEADAVARMINGQPLPKEIENAITSPLFASGGDFTTKSEIGKAKVELVRSNTDSRFYLTFEF